MKTEITEPQSPNHRSPGLRRTANSGQVVVARDLPVLFQMPAVKGAAGGPVAKSSPPVAKPAENTVNKTTTATVITTEKKKPASPPATNTAAPTPARRTPSAEKGKWFDGQGKLITICFLIALTATIYFARSRGNQSAKSNQTAWPSTHPGDAAGEVARGENMAPPAISIPSPQAPQEPPVAPIAANPLPPEPPVVPPVAPPLPTESVQAEIAATPSPEVKLLTPREAPAGRSSLPTEVAGTPENPNNVGPPVAPGSEPDPEPRVATAPLRSGWQPSTDAAPNPTEPPAGYGQPNPGYSPTNNNYTPAGGGYPLNTSPPPPAPRTAPVPNAGAYPPPAGSSLYPTTDPARFRYYNPPSSNVAPGTPTPGSQPRYERPGSSLY